MSEKIIDMKENIDLDLIPGGKEFVALLQLEDEQFQLVAPTILQIVEESMNKPENRADIISKYHGEKLVPPDEFRRQIKAADDTDELSEIKIEFLTSIYAISYNIISEEKKNNSISVAIERCHDAAIPPTYAREGDAGMDVYAIEDMTILPGETKLIHTGIKMAIPEGYEIQVRPRSGQSLKTKLRVANAPGTIDSGYRDEICVIAENIDNPVRDISFHYDDNGKLIVDSIATGAPVEIVKGQRIAQLVLAKVYHAVFFKCDNVKELGGDRGGGFGHSGQ